MADNKSRRTFERIDVGSFTLALVGLFAVIGVRLLAAADWDYGLLRAEVAGVSFQGLPAVAIGMLYTDRADTIQLLAAVAVFLIAKSIALPPRMQHWAVAVAVLLTAVALNRGLSHYVTSPKLVLLLGGSSIVAVVVLMEFVVAKDGAFWTLAVLQGTAVLIAFVSVGGIAIQRSPWLPREQLVTKQGTVQGWVIGENSN